MSPDAHDRDNTIVRQQVFAVVRFDRLSVDPRLAVNVKEILPTQREAEGEVERLNGLAQGHESEYFWMTTRYYPNGRKRL